MIWNIFIQLLVLIRMPTNDHDIYYIYICNHPTIYGPVCMGVMSSNESPSAFDITSNYYFISKVGSFIDFCKVASECVHALIPSLSLSLNFTFFTHHHHHHPHLSLSLSQCMVGWWGGVALILWHSRFLQEIKVVFSLLPWLPPGFILYPKVESHKENNTCTTPFPQHISY